MKCCVWLVLIFLGLSANPSHDLSAQSPIEKPETTRKPMPKGMTFIDQGKHDPRLKGYRTPDGFKLEIVCEEPTIINPVGMTFGPDGSLFVLEWTPDTDTWPETPEKFTYKDGTTRTIATMKKKVKDVVKVLSWNAERICFDKARVILEDELPSSILIHDGWLYLSGRGTVRRWKLVEIIEGKNFKAKPEVIALGFCGFHHHQVSGMTIGLDGWLYITSGDDDNYVEGSDGSRATVLRTGAIFRCRPDGSRMHVFSIGYRNPYRDMAQDSLGNWFHIDNDNEDGGKFTGCRLMHVAEESDFGWRLLTGARCCKPDPLRGATNAELPGKMPPILNTGRGAPAGLLYYDETQLPEFYRGWLWYPDVFRKLIRAYKVKPAGSTFEVASEFEFLKSEDPLFRPCQMVTGPDGAIYICDWRTDSDGAGKLYGDGTHGRIYRVTWSGGKVPGIDENVQAIETRDWDSWKRIHENVIDHLEAELNSSEDASLRRLAQQEALRRLPSRQEEQKHRKIQYWKSDFPELMAFCVEDKYPLKTRIACLGALNQVWNAEVQKKFISFLKLDVPDLRRLAADGLALNGKEGDKEIQAALLKAFGDTDPAVRRAIALAMGRINAEGAADDLVNAYKFDEGKDVYLTDAYLRALERCGKVGIERLVGLAKSGNDGDRDKAVDAFLGLRTRPAAEAIPDLLADPHMTARQRVALIRSYSNYLLDPPVSLDPLLEFLGKRPNEPMTVLIAALETLAEGGALKGVNAVNLLTNLLDAEASEGRMTAIRAIETARLVEAAPRLAQALVNKLRPANERIAILKALRIVGDKSAVAALKAIVSDREPTSLRAEALRSLASSDPASAEPIAVKLLDQADATLQNEAIQVLGAKPDGAKLAAQRFLDSKLPRDLLPQVSEVLRKHSANDPEIAKLHSDVIKGGLLISLNPVEIEKIRQMILAKGDARRGKAIYLNSKALACTTCHKLEGLGGLVGPDLTKLWETGTIEKIMEAIIDPSKEVKEGFQSFKLNNKNGQVFTGLKTVDKPDEVVLRDSNGKDLRFARGDIESLARSKTSLMPDNVVSQLSFDQFIDLVAFLKSRDAQESLRGMATEFLVAGPFGGDLRAPYGPEMNNDPNTTYTGSENQKVNWERRTAEPNGYLDLRAAIERDRATAYALVFVFSPKAQEAKMHGGADDTMRVWINGRLVLEQAAPQLAVPDNDSVKVELKEGWNSVLVKVTNRLGAHGLFLRFEGEGLRTSIAK
jgi:quinoprotein glucose dehydrogenase